MLFVCGPIRLFAFFLPGFWFQVYRYIFNFISFSRRRISEAPRRCRTMKERRRSWISLLLRSSPNTKALPRSLTVPLLSLSIYICECVCSLVLLYIDTRMENLQRLCSLWYPSANQRLRLWTFARRAIRTLESKFLYFLKSSLCWLFVLAFQGCISCCYSILCVMVCGSCCFCAYVKANWQHVQEC